MIPNPTRVLMADPEHFEVAYVINPHMAGNVGAVDRSLARQQWLGVKFAYEALGFEVEVVNAVAGLPDLVVCANQTLPYRTPDGRHGAVMSRMHAAQRKPEVEHFAAFFSARDYEVQRLDADRLGDFEGMGDALWHPGHFRLFGGYGYRTDRNVYARLTEALGVEVVALELTDPDFYHLDTCLSLLDERTALYYPEAFTEEGRGALRKHLPRLLEVGEREARELFACNAHCPDGRHVLLQSGAEATEALLREHDFVPLPVDTGEFLKAGGSVFCMKLMYW